MGDAGIPLTDDYTLEPQWIGDVGIRVFFDEYLERLFHRLVLREIAPLLKKASWLLGGRTDGEERVLGGCDSLAFTALLVVMAVEQGKLALEDSPKKCLLYFSLKDLEADQKIMLRHLLTHTSGLVPTTISAGLPGRVCSVALDISAGDIQPLSKITLIS